MNKASLSNPFALLSQAWSIYVTHIRMFILILLLPILAIGFVLGLAVIIGVLTGSFGVPALIRESNINSTNIVIFVILFFLAAVACIVIWGWQQIAMLYAVSEAGNIRIKEAFAKGWKNLMSYWVVSFLTGIISVIGFLLFIIPGIIFSIWYSLASFVLVAENVKGMNALRKSKEYIKGYFWQVLGRYLFWGVIIIVLSWIFPFVFKDILHLPSWFNSIFSMVSYFVSTPLGIIYSFLIYKNLKKLKGEIKSA